MTRIAALVIVGLWVGGADLWTGADPYGPRLLAQQTRSVWDGVYTKEQATRGEALYAQHCGLCHGASLAGAEMAPPLAGIEFSSNWNSLTLDDLFERIRMSMPLDDPGKLSAQQKLDILAHMLRVGQFPAGMVELTRDGQALKQIRYEATKP